MTPEKLTETFRDLSYHDADLICRLWAARDDEKSLRILVGFVPQTESYVRALHSNPYDSATWRRTVALHAIDVLLGTHGVEPIYSPEQEPGCDTPAGEYLNAGDTYTTTLVFDRDADEIRIGCMGDFVEALETDFANEGGDSDDDEHIQRLDDAQDRELEGPLDDDEVL